VADKPKITGLSFNVYAIIALLVILPISTATITNLSSRQSTESDQDLIAENFGAEFELCGNSCQATPGSMISNWLDRGDNFTSQYTNTVGYATDPSKYDCLWTSSETTPCNDFSASYGDLNQRNMNKGRNYVLMPQTHNQVLFSGGSNNDYIGQSGDDFKISIEKNVFLNTDLTKDISKIDFNMRMYDGTFYNCDSSPRANITFSYQLHLYYGVNGVFHPTKTNGLSHFETNIQTYDGDQMGTFFFNGNIFCKGELNIEVQFDVFKSIEFANWINANGGNRSNVSGYLHFYDFENKDNPQDLILNTELPFAGNDFFGLNIEANYVDVAQTNFWLKGGAALIGIGLFALALASTPYWNPVTKALKPKGGI